MNSAHEADALSRSPIFGGLSPADRAALTAGARRRRFRRGEAIFHAGDTGASIHIILEGRVKIVAVSEAGSEALLTILGPGDSFGELAVFSDEPRSADAQAMEAVSTIEVGRTALLDFLEANPKAAIQVCTVLARMIQRLSGHLEDTAFLELPARLAKALLQVAAQHGQATNAGLEINLPLTQSDLAAMVSAARQSVNRVLGEWQDRRWIRLESRGIVILKPEELAAAGHG